MKAIRINEFGGPEVLKLEEVERPIPEPDEILVKAYASGVNPVDWVVRNGGNDFLRPLLLPRTIGWDAAGIVEESGSDVKDFKKGRNLVKRYCIYYCILYTGCGANIKFCVWIFWASSSVSKIKNTVAYN